MEIMTDEALVVTAQVEIRALTVRGMQVTLALYRQLLEEPLLDADGSLAGQPCQSYPSGTEALLSTTL